MSKWFAYSRRGAGVITFVLASALTLGISAAGAVPTVKAVTSVNVGTNPRGLALSPNGNTAYVANNADGTLSVVDLSSNLVTATVNVGADPYGVAVTPDGTEVWVTRPSSGKISVISTTTNPPSFSSEIVGFNVPLNLAFNSTGTFAWLTENGSNQVLKVNQSTGSVAATVAVGTAPEGLALSPDGSKLYVASAGGSISIIDTATNAVATVNGVAPWPTQLAVTKDGRYLFISDNTGTGLVYVFDTHTNAVSNTISIGSLNSTSGVVVSNDGSTVFVGVPDSSTPTIAEIDVATLTLAAQIAVSTGPAVIAASPVSTAIYSSAWDDAKLDAITFIPPPAPAPAPAPSSDTAALAATGTDMATVLVGVALLVLTGCAFAVRARRS